MKTLKVKPVSNKLQPDFEAFEAGVRRFVGWKFKPESNAFEMQPDVCVIPDRAEYRQAIKDKDLTPADEETAKKCGVEFKSDEQPHTVRETPKK